jgi:hypothetical protein
MKTDALSEPNVASHQPYRLYSTACSNAYVERVIGSIRRECLDHLVIFNERHLRRVLSSYFDYYQGSRTHLSLRKDSPEPRPIEPRSVEQ